MFLVSYYIVCKVQLAEEQIDDRMDFLMRARVIQERTEELGELLFSDPPLNSNTI